MEDMYEKLLVELECPVCTNYMKPPIRQCATGHSICASCRNKVACCPLCQGSFTDLKNISLEALASKMHYPCVNKQRGCELKLALEEIENHELTCSYRGYECAMKKCHWIGNLEDLIIHWASKPGTNNKMYSQFNVCHAKPKLDSYYVNIVQAHGQVFWYKFKIEKGNLFWAVQYLGNKYDAKNYFYVVEIIKPATSNLKITYTDYCKSFELDNKELLKKDVCISTNVEFLERFIGEDQVLIYYLKVLKNEAPATSKNQPPKPGYSKNISKKKDQKDFEKKKNASSDKNKQLVI